EMESQVVIGSGISHDLSLGPFVYTDLLEIYVPKPGEGQITDPRDAFTERKVIVSGIYNINEELDDKYVFSSLEFARELLNLDENEITALEVKLTEGTDPEELKEKIQEVIATPVQIRNRAQLNDALYKMLN